MKYTKADKEWKLQIMKPFCEVCGKTLVILDPHHYIARSQCSELRNNIRNGVCLCRNCHNKAHQDKKWFGDWFQKNRPADKSACDNILKEFRRLE